MPRPGQAKVRASPELRPRPLMFARRPKPGSAGSRWFRLQITVSRPRLSDRGLGEAGLSAIRS
jgi:hypothetical protein